MDSPHLSYRILGVNIAVHCPTPELRGLVHAHWGQMAIVDARADLTYSIVKNEHDSSISIARPGQPTKWTSDEGQFLYQLEGDANVAIQLRRKDLYFLHAAVAEVEGSAHVFVAESGGGKSTTLWGLLHHGWSYLSDELAPIELTSLKVLAYPRALSLKRPPPKGYALPAGTIQTPRTWHVPVQHLPHVSRREACPLAAMYFVNYCPAAGAPTIRSISAAEAGARLYANTLNPLAHDNAGLDAAVHIAKSIPGFELRSADLAATCAFVCAFVDNRPK